MNDALIQVAGLNDSFQTYNIKLGSESGTCTVNIVESGDAPRIDLAQGLVAHRQLQLAANFPTSAKHE